MDHSKAHMIEIQPDNEPQNVQSVYSEHDRHEREDGEGSDVTLFGKPHASNNEYRKEHRLQNFLNTYYKTLEKLLEPYDEILLCGPGTAKNELCNRLKENKHFDKKQMEIESQEEMSENQLKAYIRKHFEHSLNGRP